MTYNISPITDNQIYEVLELHLKDLNRKVVGISKGIQETLREMREMDNKPREVTQ